MVRNIKCFFRKERKEDCLTLVGVSGLEPPASRPPDVRSNQLIYTPNNFYFKK